MPRPTVSIAVSEELARQLPPDPEERQEVLVLGLREWKVRKALEAYRRGVGSLHETVDEDFPVFSISPEAKPITLEMVQRALDES